ncbi:MAG: hypothetical protein ACI4SQ_03300 [Eubacterium sp.]
MTKDLSEKNLLAIREVFADISNVNLYDGKNVVQPEDLELLPQEMIHRDGEGNLANQLISALIKDNRTAELFQATQDPELQIRLMEEYGIS